MPILISTFGNDREVIEYGRATSSDDDTLTDTDKDWDLGMWIDAFIKIVVGTGKGQIRGIAANTLDTITLTAPWTTNPDTTSVYRIFFTAEFWWKP